jgi:hypothetical protein
MKHLSTILIISLFSITLSARESITGTVLDAETKRPLAFANIVVEGKNKGTVSNIEGHFVLDKLGISVNDVISFSYVGYEVLRMKVSELQSRQVIYLKQATVSIGEVNVSSKSLSAEQILKLVRKNYEKNYPETTLKQSIFFHKFEKSPFPESNQIIIKNSDFVGLDKNTVNELWASMPKEFNEYQDALIDLYSNEGEYKLVPTQGISIEEGTNQALMDQMESKLGDLFDDILKTKEDKKVYYQFKSGILRYKFKDKGSKESALEENMKDKQNYAVKTKEVKESVLHVLNDYTKLKSKNWEFITDNGKYYYTKEEITVFGDDVVYSISFKPKRRGLFEGTMYISTTTYAVLQLDFAFAPGKRSERFQALGFGHSMNFKKGRVIFEKGENGYFVKYINAQEHETASIDRKFSVKKRKKRFLVDKELNEIKLHAKISFDMKSNWELLVLDRKQINSQEFNNAKQPELMKFKKEFAYNPEKWKNRTVIAPTSELKKYKRK